MPRDEGEGLGEPDWRVVDPVLPSLVIRIDFNFADRRWHRRNFVGTRVRKADETDRASSETLGRLIADSAGPVVEMQKFFLGLSEDTEDGEQP